MNRENEIFISVIRDPIFRSVNRARDPPVRPSLMGEFAVKGVDKKLNSELYCRMIVVSSLGPGNRTGYYQDVRTER